MIHQQILHKKMLAILRIRATKKKKQECYCLKTNRTDVSNENNIIISESKHYKTNQDIHSRGWERRKKTLV